MGKARNGHFGRLRSAWPRIQAPDSWKDWFWENQTQTSVALGAISIVGVLVVSTIDSLTRNDGYSMANHWVSLLGLGERGWLGAANLAIWGALLLLSAGGFRRSFPDSFSGRTASGLIALLGIALLVAAVFPVDPVPTYPLGSIQVATRSGAIHALAGAAIVCSLVFIALLAVRVCRTNQLWLVGSSLAAIIPLLLLAGLMVLASARETRRFDLLYAGAFQRASLIAGAVGILCLGRSAIKDGKG
jgi:hypothetical protein